ncbi:MAG: FAD-dependent oxidoreductase [Candidatus Omnitrophica bacterium]|nr:FAD-dependent oxidoreductase [Candidatus Omnitrophota bacterium]
MNLKIHDLIIIGAGPAGMTASVYAARKKMDFIIMSSDIGGQAALSGDVENYTGYQFISGPELALKFQEHVKSFGIEVRMPESARSIVTQDELIMVETDKTRYLSRSAIVATGKRPRQLNIEGETEFKNKGLTYCATCDGPLFADKHVAVIGGGNSALDAVLGLMKISPKIYLVTRDMQLAADEVMIEKVQAASNIQIIYDAEPLRINGEVFVKNLEINKQGKKAVLNVEGIFVEIGLSPNSEFADVLSQNPTKEIIVDAHNRTSVPGIFAAGDVTNIPEKQIIIACGEGSKACLSAFHYLSTHKF